MKFFSRRKVIIEYVKKLKQEHSLLTDTDAINCAESKRGTSSLDAFSKRICREKRLY